jgi:phage shock protein C
MQSKLARSRNDRVFSGVCGGLARYTGIDVTIIRFLAIVLLVSTGVIVPLMAYLVLWLLMPEEQVVDQAPASQPASEENQ